MHQVTVHKTSSVVFHSLSPAFGVGELMPQTPQRLSDRDICSYGVNGAVATAAVAEGLTRYQNVAEAVGTCRTAPEFPEKA